VQGCSCCCHPHLTPQAPGDPLSLEGAPAAAPRPPHCGAAHPAAAAAAGAAGGCHHPAAGPCAAAAAASPVTLPPLPPGSVAASALGVRPWGVGVQPPHVGPCGAQVGGRAASWGVAPAGPCGGHVAPGLACGWVCSGCCQSGSGHPHGHSHAHLGHCPCGVGRG
jgi:hypothetical protein